MNVQRMITENLDIWTAAVTHPNGSTKRTNGDVELTGVDKLQELILELSARGRLVPQDSDDEPAAELLERVHTARDELIDNGSVKRSNKLPPVTEAEKPFPLPSTWEWARLGQLAHPQPGFAFKSNGFNTEGRGLPVVRIRDVGQTFSGTFFDGEYRDEFVVENGDYLISMDGIFRVAQWDGGKALLNQRVSRLLFFSDELESQYFVDWLRLQLERLQGAKAYTTVDHLSGKQIANIVVAVPPRDEQRRIVERVAELMALCDRLEQQSSDQINAHETLVDTLLDTLTRSQDASELAHNWDRVAMHLDTLLTTERSIDRLEQATIRLAVMGYLAPQDLNAEPASQLLERIALEKKRLAKEGSHRASRGKDRDVNEARLFQLPKQWCWAKLKDLGFTSTGKTPSTKDRSLYGGEVPFVGPGQMAAKGYIVQADKYLTGKGAEEAGLALRGDLLMVSIGGSIGKSVLAEGEVAFNQQINKLTPVIANERYIYFATLADFFQEMVRERATGSATPIISRSKWESIPVPVPPLAEQERIVERIDELREVYDRLRALVSGAEKIKKDLAERLLKGVAA